MSTKLCQFIKRNRRRNAHLYLDSTIEGYDYVICPISGERLSMIKDNYISKILGISPKDYPDVQRICNKRKENISTGLKEIDSTTGLSKYEVGQLKARKILNSVDDQGISGYKKKGQRTRATHMSKIDEYGRNGYSRLATKAILKGNKTKAEKGIISLDQNEFKRYKLVVLYLTEKYRKELTDGYVTGLAGTAGAWHIDHRFSILKGYQDKISPLVIGNRINLEMKPWKENISKHSKCSVGLDRLLNDCGYSKEQATAEFVQFINFIAEDITNEVPPNGAFLIERFYAAVLRNQ